MSHDLSALAEAHVKAWSAGDAEAVAACFTADCVFVDQALGATFNGRDEVRGFAEAVNVAIPDFTWTITRTIVEGDRICYESVFTGTQTGDFPGIPATGKPVEIPCLSIDHVRDGLIHTHADYWSLATYLQQVGLMPSPEAN